MPDFSKPAKRESPPEENIKVNTVLSLLTVIVSFSLAILLYAILGFRESTHWLIYLTAGMLIAIGAWHVQTFIRARRLKKQWKRRNPQHEEEKTPTFESASTARLLERPDFENVVPASVTDHTTKHLTETKIKSS